LSKIYDAETSLIQKFCALNKSGDDAMKNHNCPAAKDYYSRAIDLLPAEQYPKDQISKTELCIKNKKEKDEAIAAEAAEKAATNKIANDKIIAEKTAKDKALFEKAANDQLAKEKMLEEKKSKNKPSPEKEDPQKEDPEKIKVNETEPTTNGSIDKKGRSNHSIAQPIGKNLYKETITKADGFFKMKRYAEAKTEYIAALKIKADDLYCKNGIDEINKLTNPK
jgi:hypothetical protein